MRGRIALLAAAVALGACDRTDVAYFRSIVDPDPDLSPPVFSNPVPAPGSGTFTGGFFTVDVTDLGSGVDPTSIEATTPGSTALLPITVALPRITVDVSPLPDGRAQVIVVARDLVGNPGAHIFDVQLDRPGQ